MMECKGVFTNLTMFVDKFQFISAQIIPGLNYSASLEIVYT